MKRIYFIILTLCAYIFASAQCTKVNKDGSVTISSVTATSSAIERQDGVDWVEIGNLQEGVFTDKNVNANEKFITYRIPISSNKSKFSTIFLQVTGDVNNSSIIKLKWTNNPDATSYKVYRKTVDDEDFVFVDDVDKLNNNYDDNKLSDCAVEYKIEAIENDCSSFSNIALSPKSDNEEPVEPMLQPINVDIATQKIVVTWTKSPSVDTRGYVVCKMSEDGTRQPLETIYGADITTYTCESCNVKDTNKITVFAFDNCKNTSPLSKTINNIVLNANRNSCDDPLHLSWNTPSEDFDGFTCQVYMATDEDMQYKQIAEVQELSYDVELPQVNGNVYFYVVCGGVSNVVKVDVTKAETLDFVYVESVSISPDNMQAEIKIFLDAGKKVKGYQLWRKMDSEEFEKVKDIDFTGHSYMTVTDELPFSAFEHLYTYYVAAPDVCGINYTNSNKFTAMRLLIDATNTSKIKLSWNSLKPANWNVSTYEVYRYAENDFDNAKLIAKTPSSSYIDNVESMVSATDRTYYYVKAIAASSTNPDIAKDGVNSSSAYAKFESVFFIPNAFCPKENVHQNLTTFKPACHFVRAGSYSFKVFNRAGTLLFETNDTDKGWNGTYKGEYCPVGTYIYKVSFIDSDGMEQNKGGMFLLYD